MIGKRTRFYLISGLLAVPPVALAGYLCNSFVPQPEQVPAVVGANDPEVDLAPHPAVQATQQVQLATRQH